MKASGSLFKASLTILSISLLSACGGGGGGGTPADNPGNQTPTPAPSTPRTISTSSPDDLSSAMSVPNATRKQGPIPVNGATSSNLQRSTVAEASGVPMVSTTSSVLTATPGGSATIEFSLNSSAGYDNCFVQIAGASDYFEIPAPSGDTSGTMINETLQIPLTFDQNITFSDEGEFCAQICVVDDNGNYSNVSDQCFSAQNVGTGDLQVSLSWNNASDVDLYVQEPNGNVIFYGNTAATGASGELDRDDVDGFGPENIFLSNLPQGDYIIGVDLFSGEPASYTVNINAFGQSRVLQGTVSGSNIVTLATVSASGSSASISNGGARVTPAGETIARRATIQKGEQAEEARFKAVK